MAVTAFAMRQDERLVREAGCEAYMSKPIQMSAFINEVKKLTGPRGPGGQPTRSAAPPSTRRSYR
jgi:two-component system cell cycle response regulator DivK